jgi:hypothetical protein
VGLFCQIQGSWAEKSFMENFRLGVSLLKLGPIKCLLSWGELLE